MVKEEDFIPGTTTCAEAEANPAVKVEKVIKVKSMSEADLEAALLKSPVKVAIDAGSMAFQSYSGGILSGDDCGT